MPVFSKTETGAISHYPLVPVVVLLPAAPLAEVKRARPRHLPALPVRGEPAGPPRVPPLAEEGSAEAYLA